MLFYILLHSCLIYKTFVMKLDSPGKTTTEELLLPFFLCFQMAQIILNIDMEVALELDAINNRIILHNVDRVLTITVINNQTLVCFKVAIIRTSFLFTFLASSPDILCYLGLRAIHRLGGVAQQYMVSFFYVWVMYYVLVPMQP